MWFLKEHNIYTKKVTKSSVNLVNGFFWNLKNLRCRRYELHEQVKSSSGLTGKKAGLNYQKQKVLLIILPGDSYENRQFSEHFPNQHVFFSESFEVRLLATQTPPSIPNNP